MMNRHNQNNHRRNKNPHNHTTLTNTHMYRQNTQSKHTHDTTTQELNIIHWNCRSIQRKTPILISEIQKYPPDIFALQEITLRGK